MSSLCFIFIVQQTIILIDYSDGEILLVRFHDNIVSYSVAGAGNAGDAAALITILTH